MGDDFGEGGGEGEEGVGFFEEGAAGLGEGGEPGGGHADALDALACDCLAGVLWEGGGKGVSWESLGFTGEEEGSFRAGGRVGGEASSWWESIC